MQVSEWLAALSHLYKFMLDSAVDDPLWKIEQVIEYFTEDEKNEAILFYLPNANLDDYQNCTKHRIIAKWVCKADCFKIRKSTKTALKYLEAYGLADLPKKADMAPNGIAKIHKHCIDTSFDDSTIQSVDQVILAANKDLLKQISLLRNIHFEPAKSDRAQLIRNKLRPEEEYLSKRGLSEVPKIESIKPKGLYIRHKAEVEKLLAKRASEIDGLISGALKQYLRFYMEAQVERDVSSKILASAAEMLADKKALADYHPTKIKYLFIADAPPNSFGRSLYGANPIRADYMFYAIMRVLDKEFEQEYRENRNSDKYKMSILDSFRDNGFFLIDLLELPQLQYTSRGQARQKAIPGLLDRISKIITKDTPIILLQEKIYAALFKILKDAGYNVVDTKIPYPNNGNQTRFKEQLSLALTNSGWDLSQPLKRSHNF